MNKKMMIISKASDGILDIIDHLDEFDRGDLQGVIEAQLMKLFSEVKNDN